MKTIKLGDLARAYAEAEILMDLKRQATIERGRSTLYDLEVDFCESEIAASTTTQSALEHLEKAKLLDAICDAIISGQFSERK